MSSERLYIVGAGGHARVVADAMMASGTTPGALCFVDDKPEIRGSRLLGIEILGPVAALVVAGTWFHVAIGSALHRERLQRQLIAAGAIARTVVHPRAIVSPHAGLGAGSFIAAGAIVAPLARLGDGVIVNHSAVVDHDCEVGSWSHIAPQATLGGAARIGEAALIGANATVLPGKHVGDRAIVGAGSVVVRDVRTAATSVGVPARELQGKGK